MIELNELELALKCCQKFILPIFDDVNYFNKLTSLYCDRLENHFFAISDTLLMFKRPDFEEYIKKLVQMLTEMKLSGESIKNFVQTIKNNFEFYKTSPSVLSIIQMRINFLEAQIGPSLEFNWRMNGTVQGHPRFEQFLKSDDMKMAYSGVLNGVAQARRFISSYSGVKQDYSVNMDFKGSGSKVIVHITKNRDYFDSKTVNNRILMLFVFYN
ncbi:hypothetical protein BpHYR1_014435 [Brachionus plicatilis]|uniref:Uncharacterized protein n=1 Tax=Brachionus plicatilis TaxID=10195 RepID=A0A3M7RK62_BRAPC|nr:hypothetical protein BpHYR1_014435 [Brachionus plicatilis]